MIKSIFFKHKLISLLSFVLLNMFFSPIVLAQIVSQESTKSKIQSSSVIALNFPKVPEETRKSPKDTAGAGKRGTCIPYRGRKRPPEAFLVALMPNRIIKGNVIANKRFYSQAKTASSRPDFWFYIPKNKAESAEFNITDENGTILIKLNLPSLPEATGMVKVELPEEIQLQVNKTYNWSFSLNCGSKSTVEGNITRVPLSVDIETQLNAIKEPIEKARLYAQNYLWNETFSILVSLSESNPREWRELLESVGLEDYYQQPILTISN